jgi:hypothetical protein
MEPTQVIADFEELSERGHRTAATGELLTMMRLVREKRVEDSAVESMRIAVANRNMAEVERARPIVTAAWTADEERLQALVEAFVAEELVAAWRPRETWSNLVGQYDNMADGLTRILRRVDPDKAIGPEMFDLVDPGVLDDIKSVPEVTGHIDRLLDTMCLVIRMAGVPAGFDHTDPAHMIAAFCDTSEAAGAADLPALWRATGSSRAGRWKALVAAGCIPKAAPSLSAIALPKKKGGR